MILFIGAAVFVVGVLLGIRLLAGLYSILDLWYDIGRSWRIVLRRVIGWTTVTAAALMLLDGWRRWVLLAGMATHALVYVAATLGVVLTGSRKPRPTPTVE